MAVQSRNPAAGVSKVTVYNHFGSKEELFTDVVGEAMGEVRTTIAELGTRLADTGDVREALMHIARALTAAATDPSRMALRNLVTGELRRFPELGRAYQARGPALSAIGLGEVFGDLYERGQLTIPDPELAVVQFFGLTIYPHLIVGSISASLRQDLAERVIKEGVDLFLSR